MLVCTYAILLTNMAKRIVIVLYKWYEIEMFKYACD